MRSIYNSLMLLLATATDRELAKYVQFLKAENRLLRSRIEFPVHLQLHERRRLLKYGRELGKAVYELITIVTPNP